MDQFMVPNWPEDTGVDPKDLQLNHMTVPELPLRDDSFRDVPPSLRYFHSFGNLHTDLLSLADPDTDGQAQNADISVSAQDQLDGSNFQHNEASVPSSGYASQRLQGFNACRDTTHNESQSATSNLWAQRSLDVFANKGIQSPNEPAMAVPPQDTIRQQTSMHSSFPSMNSFPEPTTSSTPKSSSRRAIAQTTTARNQKLQSRRPPQRASAPRTQRRNMQSTMVSSRSFDGKLSHTFSQSDTTKPPTIAPQDVLALFEASIQTFSTSTQLKLADLICQMKKLVLLEQRKSSISAVSTTPSTKDSVSNSEMADWESLTDQTTVSSTPRQSAKDTENTEESMSVEDMETSAKHEPCNHCNVKTLYQCTWKNCGYGTHLFAGYKRHEASDKHWPQDRFMCLQCVDHTTPTLSSGEPICKFCLIPLSSLGSGMRSHYVKCESARKVVATFSRKDHIINHLRKDHGMSSMNDTVDSWKYGINSNWPRQCGFCGVNFLTWTERMIHLKVEHFDKGADISTWRIPFFPGPKDNSPSGINPSKDDDDHDEDDSPHGGSGGAWVKAPGQQSFQNSAPPAQSQSSSSANQQSWKTSNKRYRKAQLADEEPHDSSQDKNSMLLEIGPTSLALERYLNDIEEPIAARLTLGTTTSSSPLHRTETTNAMVDPISVTSGLLALVGFAFTASTTLYQTVQSFKVHPKQLRDLKEELEALNGALDSLNETVSAATIVDLSALGLPLLRCGNACKDFGQEIINCPFRSGVNGTSFRDWAKLRYMGDDIVGFKNMLAGYKFTIMIALGDANLRTSGVTMSVLNEYEDMITNTTVDLEQHLQEIDERLQTFSPWDLTLSDESAVEQLQIQEERDCTQQCLNICAQVVAHICQLQPTAFENISTPPGVYMVPSTKLEGHTSARISTADMIKTCKENLSDVDTKLESHLEDIVGRLRNHTSSRSQSSNERAAEEERIIEEPGNIKQCLAIYAQASLHSNKERISVVEDISTADDGLQLLVSTTGDMVSAKRVIAGARSRQCVGQISVDSLQKLLHNYSHVAAEGSIQSQGDTC